MELEAVPRRESRIWITWLARVMAARVNCHWQYWFQSHNRLLSRQPTTLDTLAWRIDHNRLLTTVKQEILRDGLRPHSEVELQFRLSDIGALLVGKVDCLLEDASRVMIYDCKTGKPNDSDRVQVMIYMHGLGTYPRYYGKRIEGTVVYSNDRIEIPYLPEQFASNLRFFAGLLSGSEAPAREPGQDCAYCNLTSTDCPERQDVA